MKYTKIYIGSNDDTRTLEIGKIKKVLSVLKGYTITFSSGYWNNIEEEVAIIEIYGDYNLGIIPQLKQTLTQKSILVAESIVDANFYE